MQGLAQRADHIVLLERARGQVDRDRASRLAPLRAPATGLLQHPAVHGGDQGALLGDRDELVGREKSETGALPADQGLGADHPFVGQRHDRLVQDAKLVAGDGPAQGVAHRELGVHGQLHRAVEDRGTGLAADLRLVHGQVRLPQQVLGGGGGVGRRDEADAGADDGLVIPDREGRRELAADPGGDGRHDRAVGHVGAHHDELVTSQTGDHVFRAQARADALAGQHEELVADCVSQTVVDLLEAVQVDEQDGQALSGAGARRERLVEVPDQGGPVGQPGQRVLQCLSAQHLVQRAHLA